VSSTGIPDSTSAPGDGAVARRLTGYLAPQSLPGLRSRPSREKFLRELQHSLKKYRALRIRRFPGSTDPSDPEFQPYLTILESAEAGGKEEAIWLSFLTTLCGPVSGDGARWESVRCLYGAFDGPARWTWDRVQARPESLRAWMTKHRDKVRRLRFGNHRKYETHDPAKRGSTAAIVESYVEWVAKGGNGSQVGIFEEAVRDRTPEAAFDNLFRRIRVKRFGRTARFDWLCLVGNLGLFPLAPGLCYLRSASGPRVGAKRLFGSSGAQDVDGLEEKAAALARALEVPLEVMEDTLCNWQKRGIGTRAESV